MQKTSFFIIFVLILSLTISGINQVGAQENSRESEIKDKQRAEEKKKIEQKKIEDKQRAEE